MTKPPKAPAPPASTADVRPSRVVDLALARVHLRLGSLALARSELESLAGRGALDGDGLLDLVEARWRTGDVVGAGEAAALALDDDGDGPLIALVVAAEVAVHEGRPTEARRFAERAIVVAGPTLDTLFAGMPRGPVWPPDATDRPATTPAMFGTPIAGRAAAAAAVVPPLVPVVPDEPTGPAAPGGTIGLWDAAVGDAPVDVASAASSAAGGPAPADATAEPPGPPDATAIRLAGEAALAAGDVAAAVMHLSLALRLQPGCAADVADAVGAHPDPRLALVRGDAYRLLGREAEARRAYTDAARGLTPPDPA